MTDKITKVLRKTSLSNRKRLLEIFEKVAAGKVEGCDIRQISGSEDLYRIRSGEFRIILRKSKNGFVVVDVRKRDDQTYKNL